MAPLLDAIGDGSAFLAVELRAGEMDTLRRHERTRRPLGDGTFVATLEADLGRRLRPFRPGRRRGRGEEGLMA